MMTKMTIHDNEMGGCLVCFLSLFGWKEFLDPGLRYRDQYSALLFFGDGGLGKGGILKEKAYLKVWRELRLSILEFENVVF